MRKAESNQEQFIGANWLAKQLEVNRGQIDHYAKKGRMRYFKWWGMRWLEVNQAIALADSLAKKYQVNYDDTIQLLRELKGT